MNVFTKFVKCPVFLVGYLSVVCQFFFIFLPGSAQGIRWLALHNTTGLSWSSNETTEVESTACARARSSGLLWRTQERACRAHEHAMPHVVAAAARTRLACLNARAQNRWNCSSIDMAPNYSPELLTGTREQAFVYAVSSLALAWSVARACAAGALAACSCAPPPLRRPPRAPPNAAEPSAFKWGGCADNLQFANRFAKKFIDAHEIAVKNGRADINEYLLKHQFTSTEPPTVQLQQDADSSFSFVPTPTVATTPVVTFTTTATTSTTTIALTTPSITRLISPKAIPTKGLGKKKRKQRQDRKNGKLKEEGSGKFRPGRSTFRWRSRGRGGRGGGSNSGTGGRGYGGRGAGSRKGRGGRFGSRGGWRGIEYMMAADDPRFDPHVDLPTRLQRLHAHIATANLQNSRLGRKILSQQVRTKCTCHGVSGSCSVRTCWRSLPALERALPALDAALERALPTRSSRRALNVHEHDRDRARLLYVTPSPDYCEPDPYSGSLGTHGRQCNASLGRSPGGCGSLCCGRGRRAERRVVLERCRCRYHWCCYVECDVCKYERIDHYCK